MKYESRSHRSIQYVTFVLSFARVNAYQTGHFLLFSRFFQVTINFRTAGNYLNPSRGCKSSLQPTPHVSRNCICMHTPQHTWAKSQQSHPWDYWFDIYIFKLPTLALLILPCDCQTLNFPAVISGSHYDRGWSLSHSYPARPLAARGAQVLRTLPVL